MDVTSRLWIARFLQDRELELEAESRLHTVDVEQLQLEEIEYGNDPYNLIGKHVKEKL